MSPDAEALLERVRDADYPTAEDERRVLAAVYGAVGGGALLGVGGASKLGKLFAAWGASGAKIGMLALVLASAGVAAFSASRAPAPSVLKPWLDQRTEAIGKAVGSPVSTPELRLPAVEARAAQNEPSEAAPPASLRAELALLAEAQAALKRGDAAGALRLLDQHRTSDRQLLAERRAARILALCAVGRTDEAKVAGAAFLRENTASPQRAAVERSCAGPASSGPR